MLCNAALVGRGKGGRHGFAAVATTEAIDILPHLVAGGLDGLQHPIFVVTVFEAGNKAAVAPLVLLSVVPELFKIDRHERF